MRKSNLQLAFSVFLTAGVVLAAASSSAIAAETTADIYERSKNAVVVLKEYDSYGELTGLGSGFYFETNRIASNFHVVANASSVEFRFIGSKDWHAVKKIALVSEALDLAVLEVDVTGTPLKICSVESVRVGDKIVAIGNPQGLEGTPSEGILSGKDREVPGRKNLLQITAPISPGSSGGPVFTAAGEVVGVATATLIDSRRTAQNLNFAVPASLLLTLSGPARAWEPVRPNYGTSSGNAETKRGMSPEQMVERYTEQLSLTDEQKPKVKAVLEDSAKKRRGLFRDSSLDQEQKRAKFRDVMDAQNKKMKEILTPDQFTKYQEMNEKMKKGGKKKAE